MSKLKRPMTPDQVIESIAIISSKPVDVPMERGMKGAIVGILDSLLGTRALRNSILYILFYPKWLLTDEISSNDLTEGEWAALKRWIGPHKPEGEKWQGTADFCSELGALNYFPKEEPEEPKPFFAEFCIGRFGCIPEMACGHKATEITCLFEPFCKICADSGQNKEAYTVKSEQSIMEQGGEGVK